MRLSLLRIIHKSAYDRAIYYKYYGDFPSSLSSFDKSNPSVNDIEEDYIKMRSHFNHPVFKNWIPTYDELTENKYLSWTKRSSKNFICKNQTPK